MVGVVHTSLSPRKVSAARVELAVMDQAQPVGGAGTRRRLLTAPDPGPVDLLDREAGHGHDPLGRRRAQTSIAAVTADGASCPAGQITPVAAGPPRGWRACSSRRRSATTRSCAGLRILRAAAGVRPAAVMAARWSRSRSAISLAS
jgi:hypothetical protein